MKPILLCLALLVSVAHADLVITEVMADSAYGSGTTNGDWWELTNTGPNPVSLNGYSWEDEPEVPLKTSTFPSGITIAVGESIVILQHNADEVASWKSAWGLVSNRVLAKDLFSGEQFSSLSKNGDEVNLYNAGGTLVAHVKFGASIEGQSKSFLRDGTPIYGEDSTSGYHGAVYSSGSTDIGSPTDAGIHFTSVPEIYGNTTYSYLVNAAKPGSAAPTFSAGSLPSFLSIGASSGGSATLSNNRPLTLADAGNYLIDITASSSSSSTIQRFLLTIFNESPSIILNEYNAVSDTKYLNGGTLTTDNDGTPPSTDSHFGRVLGNGGQWFELVVVGSGSADLVDLRGWKVEIGTNTGEGFTERNTIVFSNHPDWQTVPTGTILTLIDRTTAQGGLDSGFALRDNRATLGDTWTNIWIGDPDYITYTNSNTNGYTLSGGVVTGIIIDNDSTQFRLKNPADQIVFGPAGEGVAPPSGTSSTEILELENDPTPLISPLDVTTDTTQGYDDGASGSTFGSPNNWIADVTPATQSFIPYIADLFQQWALAYSLNGDDALRSADPDGDGRNNFDEYAFGGDPNVKDAAYPSGPIIVDSTITWSYVRRSDDPSISFSYQTSENLLNWFPVNPASEVSAEFPGDPAFSTVTLTFARPVPAPARWFLRTKAGSEPDTRSSYQQWTDGYALSGNDALPSADPDGDDRNNFNEYAFGGDPTTKDAAYPTGPITAGPEIGWSYVRRNNDPSLTFDHQASEDLSDWSPVAATSTTLTPFPSNPDFSTVTLTFHRPIPAPMKWFLRATVE